MNITPARGETKAISAVFARRTFLVTAAAATLSACARPATKPLTLFAAASLVDAIGEIVPLFQAAGGPEVRPVFAGSGELARQIEAGAPADVIILADDVWMTRLSGTGAVRPDTVVPLLTNSLVVIAAADRPEMAFAWSGRIAIGDPDSVPAGRYAREALTALGLWDTLEPRLVLAGDVRAVRAFVARGEVDLGIVYLSDTTGFDAVRVVHVPARQPGIVYPAAVTTTAAPTAIDLMAFLRGPQATAVFVRHGFGTPR